MSQEVHKKLRKKIFYKGILKNKTAFSIGFKEGDFIDSLCLKDKENKPYISATSLAGVLKSKLKNNPLLGDDDNKSLVILSDCECINSPKMGIRNGVAIDYKNEIAKKGALFDYEVVFKGTKFNFECLVNIYENDFTNEIEEFESLINSELLIGMKTMSGFGEFIMCELKKTEFDFSKANEFNRYEKFLKEPFYESKIELKESKKDFKIELELDIANSLLIGSVNNDGEIADVASLCEDDKFIASGTSFKGAIRHQALRIANAFSEKLGEGFVNELFGFVDGDTAKKSRVRVNESEIKKSLAKLHQRNKIDRFSGATIDGALFDARAVYAGQICLKIELINPSPKEKALMLFVVRDLCAGFLAVGGGKNVGRGVFSGKFSAYENGEELSKNKMNEIAKELLK